MKRIFLLALTALVSFAVGIGSATIWISKHSPTVPPVASSNNCTPVYDATFVGKRINENDDPQLFAAGVDDESELAQTTKNYRS
jgi:hypothetical protein